MSPRLKRVATLPCKILTSDESTSVTGAPGAICSTYRGE